MTFKCEKKWETLTKLETNVQFGLHFTFHTTKLHKQKTFTQDKTNSQRYETLLTALKQIYKRQNLTGKGMYQILEVNRK